MTSVALRVLRNFGLALVALLPLCGGASAADPKVPPALDPGLTPLALVGFGVDYTDKDLSTRLARDGEGNIVGWDFVDSDIFPYSKDATSNAEAKLLLSNPKIELAPIRVGFADYNGVAGAAGFLSHTPIRTVVITLTSAQKQDWDLFAQAAQFFKKLLFVVPVGDGAPAFPAALNLDNVLSVALPAAGDQPADIAYGGSPDAATPPVTHAEAAILAAAALVTCHADAIGEGDGKVRKAAILAKLAQPRSVSRVPGLLPCP